MAITYSSQILTLYNGSVGNDAAYQSPGTYGLPASSVRGALQSIAVTAPGTGYTCIPTVTISGSGGGTATAKLKVISATVAAGGSGGTDGAGTIVTGTTGTGTRFQASVTVSGGAIASVQSITLGGSYSVVPSSLSNEPVTGGNVTGGQLAIVLGVESITVGAGGAYQVTPTIGFTGGAGSGATATATLANDEEAKLLTLIEVVRSYFASVGVEEANTAKDVLLRMISRANTGGTFNASTIATAMQKAGVVRYAKRPRNTDF